MRRHRQQTTLTELAKLGFTELGEAGALLDGLADDLVPAFRPRGGRRPGTAAARRAASIRAEAQVDAVLARPDAADRLIRVLGASRGIAEFFLRHPGELAALLASRWTTCPTRTSCVPTCSRRSTGLVDDAAFTALRVRYRRHLARLAAWDLSNPDPLAAVSHVTGMLADLAGAALDASLDVARRSTRFSDAEVANTRLAIIGMGKSGARELNYVSDVDVIFVVEAAGDLGADRAVEIGTRLAMQTARGIQELASEPTLWEVDANLRPEGKDGALVRTLESHLAYYERWAKSWEFQALLKARPLAGDLELGERYVDGHRAAGLVERVA